MEVTNIETDGVTTHNIRKNKANLDPEVVDGGSSEFINKETSKLLKVTEKDQIKSDSECSSSDQSDENALGVNETDDIDKNVNSVASNAEIMKNISDSTSLDIEPAVCKQATCSNKLNAGASGSSLLPLVKSVSASVEPVNNRKLLLQELLKVTSAESSDTSLPKQGQAFLFKAINTKVIPTSHPTGPQLRKPPGETFVVKSVQDNETSSKTSNYKTKIRPIFGHVSVTKITKAKGLFPVIYIGAPNISDMQAYRKMSQNKSTNMKRTIESVDDGFQKHNKNGDINLSLKSNPTSPNSETSFDPTAGRCITVTVKPKTSTSNTSSKNNTVLSTKYSSNAATADAVTDDFKKYEYGIRETMEGFLQETSDSKELKKKPSFHSTASQLGTCDSPLPSMVYSDKGLLETSVTTISHAGGKSTVPLYTPKVNPPLAVRDPFMPSAITTGNTSFFPYSIVKTSNFGKTPITVHIPASTSVVMKPVSTATSSKQIIIVKSGIQVSSNSVISTVKICKPAPPRLIAPKSNVVLTTCTSTAPSIISSVNTTAATVTKSSAPTAPILTTITSKALKRKADDVIIPKVIPSSKVPHVQCVEAINKPVKKLTVLSPLTSTAAASSNTKTTPSSYSYAYPSSRKPGVLVKFEDEVQLWIDKLRDLTFLDDEPVKSWKLERGIPVAAKYTDGLFYDAVVMSSFDGSSAVQAKGKEDSKDAASAPSKPQECKTVKIEFLKPIVESKASSETNKECDETSLIQATKPKEESSVILPKLKEDSNDPQTVSTKSHNEIKKTKLMNERKISETPKVARKSFVKNVSKSKRKAIPSENQKTKSSDEEKISDESVKLPRVHIKKLNLNGRNESWDAKLISGDVSGLSPPPNKKNCTKNVTENSLNIKCPTCFLVFGNVMLFRKHQKTVCGTDGVTVTGFQFEPNVLVKVDESEIPPLVKSQPLKDAESGHNMRLIPRARDGKRCFRRGSHILHRWQTFTGSKWYNGKILRVLDTSKGTKCEFEVEYTDDDHDSGPYAVALYEDYPHDIRIVTR